MGLGNDDGGPKKDALAGSGEKMTTAAEKNVGRGGCEFDRKMTFVESFSGAVVERSAFV